jgi:hypothetical protein
MLIFLLDDGEIYGNVFKLEKIELNLFSVTL